MGILLAHCMILIRGIGSLSVGYGDVIELIGDHFIDFLVD